MNKIVHKKLDHETIRITVEELSPFKFIATYWDSEIELEDDRTVREFETFGGAMESAFDFLVKTTDSNFKE